jgi:hypothetical protein
MGSFIVAVTSERTFRACSTTPRARWLHPSGQAWSHLIYPRRLSRAALPILWDAPSAPLEWGAIDRDGSGRREHELPLMARETSDAQTGLALERGL